MERALSSEERIKRAEEIYYRKRIQADKRESARVNVGERKKIGLFKKMFLQILICLGLYLIFYLIQTTNYVFSDKVIYETNNILSYDINLQGLYDKAIKYINNFKLNKKENVDAKPASVIEETLSATDENINQEIEQAKEESSISQMEIDANEVLSTASLIIPLNGAITSRFGVRNPTTITVPIYHTGIDIGADEGSIIIASMAGVAELVSSEGNYGNHIKITNGDIITLYAHCKTIYVKEGEQIIQGQQIAEVGSTGNVTGPHLHFEVRKSDRYIDPDLLLKFD